MSEFYTSVFRDGNKADRRTIREVGRAMQPPTAGGSGGARSGVAAMGTHEITQHADGENIQLLMWDVDPWDDEHYVW